MGTRLQAEVQVPWTPGLAPLPASTLSLPPNCQGPHTEHKAHQPLSQGAALLAGSVRRQQAITPDVVLNVHGKATRETPRAFS